MSPFCGIVCFQWENVEGRGGRKPEILANLNMFWCSMLFAFVSRKNFPSCPGATDILINFFGWRHHTEAEGARSTIWSLLPRTRPVQSSLGQRETIFMCVILYNNDLISFVSGLIFTGGISGNWTPRHTFHSDAFPPERPCWIPPPTVAHVHFPKVGPPPKPKKSLICGFRGAFGCD